MLAPMPQTVKVGPQVYKVVRKPSAALGSMLGRCEFNKLEIWVAHRLRRGKAQEIITHEVTHACTHPSCNDGELHTDEQFVENVSLQWLGVLRDNPQLVAYLIS